MEINPEATPYAVYADCPESVECDYCAEGMEFSAGHVHEYYENRAGASHRTADELADVFLDAVEYYAAPWTRPEYCPRDVVGWLDDPDASQSLSDCIALGESALADVGLDVTWEDGYIIERITERDAFDADRSPMARAMADGHRMRMGHALEGYYSSDEFPRLIRTCCQENGEQ